jgi:hypothetical protein
MNKEQLELLDKAYDDYCDLFTSSVIEPHTKKMFIDKCKHNIEYSIRWGLKIEERELTYLERYKMWFSTNYETGMEYYEDNVPDFDNEYYEPTPTKLITTTYKDKIIEGYEQ